MTIQLDLEKKIYKLVSEFLKEPYKFFTEADAVVRFHQILDKNSTLNRKAETTDGDKVSLFHREYPTFFRFSDSNPTKKLGPPASRGHYDTVILNSDFVKVHSSATVANRQIDLPRDKSITPFNAVIEFKFHDYGWSSNRAESVICELGKLRLSKKESPLRYLIVLTRYRSPVMNRWNKYWPIVKKEADKHKDINSVFAVNWLEIKRKPEIYVFGNWKNKELKKIGTVR